MTRAMPEDLINKVIAADALRRQARGDRPARFHPSQRIWIEPFFNLLGLLWGQLTLFLPWPIQKRYVQWIVRKMGGHAAVGNPELPARIQEMTALARELQAKTGQWPALLVAMSHPETEGPLQWLRFEMMSQGLEAADALIDAHFPRAWYPVHPRCLLAIDPYALDTVSPAVGGFYAAWMNRIYLAYDRQSATQSWVQRQILLRGADYSRITWKLLKLLRHDAPVLMALGGGLPFNARLLYGAREFVHRLKINGWKISKRQAQLELLEILMTSSGGALAAEKGELSAEQLSVIRQALMRWGLPASAIDAAIDEFRSEFKRPIPYRARLFRVLTKRLVERGKPVMVLPLSHEEASTLTLIRIGRPVALTAGSHPQLFS